MAANNVPDTTTEAMLKRIEGLEKALMVVIGFMSSRYGDTDPGDYPEVDLVFAAIDQAGDLGCLYTEAREWVDLDAYYRTQELLGG